MLKSKAKPMDEAISKVDARDRFRIQRARMKRNGDNATPPSH
jgi:hypothetical protein